MAYIPESMEHKLLYLHTIISIATVCMPPNLPHLPQPKQALLTAAPPSLPHPTPKPPFSPVHPFPQTTVAENAHQARLLYHYHTYLNTNHCISFTRGMKFISLCAGWLHKTMVCCSHCNVLSTSTKPQRLLFSHQDQQQHNCGEDHNY